jgi:hypothetical protein
MSDAAVEEIEINLIVEDGTCTQGANSYISLEDAVSYQTDRNRTDWLELSDNEKKASLIKATQYVDNLFKWKGIRKYHQEQPLNFPRVNIFIEGYSVKEMPRQIKDAVCEAAYYGFQEDLFTVRESDIGNIKRIKDVVEDAVEEEIEYFNKSESKVDFISKYAALDSILRGLYEPLNTSRINGKADWDY